MQVHRYWILLLLVTAMAVTYKFYFLNSKLNQMRLELNEIRSARGFSLVDHERLDNFLSMKGLPSGEF